MRKHDPYSALRHAPYRRYLGGSLAMFLGNQAVMVALGWHLYGTTGSAWTLALIGLFNYLPILFFSLPAGLLADRFPRRIIMRLTLALQVLCTLAFAWLAAHPGPLALWYAVIFLWASAKAIQTPASVSFYPTLMPENSVPNAVSWNTANFQIGAILGPILGGFLTHRLGPEGAFLSGAAGNALYFFLVFGIKPLRQRIRKISNVGHLQQVLEGLKFVYHKKPILGALTLDLFAVLFGGVEAVLPIFARDILGVGAVGLGFLRAAGFAGAFCMGFFIAHRPLKNPGPAMFAAVAVFGLCMLVFAISKNFYLSLAMLALSGAMDNISVVVRQTLVQMSTPDHLRGRVQSVNFLFIGSSNELGEFESGAAAAAMGTVPSVIFGGAAVLAVVAVIAWKFPELRQLRSLK